MKEDPILGVAEDVAVKLLVAFLKQPLNQSRIADLCVECGDDKWLLFERAFKLGVMLTLHGMENGAITPIGKG